MKRTLFLLLLVCSVLLCACGGSIKNEPINPGETYLNGGFYNDALCVGYSFFPNGTGFQFIGSTVNPIRYGVFDGRLFVSVNGVAPDSLSFEKEGESLLIGGIAFLPLADDPEQGKSLEAMLSEQYASEEAGKEDPSLLSPLWLLPVLAIITFVLFLALWVRKKSRIVEK